MRLPDILDAEGGSLTVLPDVVAIDITTIPELVDLVDEVRRTRQPRILRRGKEDVALLTPLPAAAAPKRRRARDRVLTADDPMFDLIGIGSSGGAGDVSANKHRYLAEAYRAKTTRDPAR